MFPADQSRMINDYRTGTGPREVVCHCLGVERQEIVETIERGAAQSVKCVARETGAGSGCTACHCTIRNMLEAAGYQVRCHTRGRSDALALTDELAPIAG